MNRINSIVAFVAVNIAAGFALLSPASAEMDIVDTAANAGSFNTLIAAAQAAGLVDALKADGPITVFAPNDEAFARLPAGTVESLLEPENISKLQAVLKYHVVAGAVMSADAAKLDSAPTLLGQEISISPSGSGLAIDNANVIAADIEASNGIIHVIDSVLMPRDLVAVATEAGSFKTLAAAAQAAGLIDTLKSGGPFTIFAPTDEAFAKLPAGTIDELLKPENRDQLKAILTYHVVPGVYTAADVTGLSEVPTVSGTPLRISASSRGVAVSGSNVIATDIQAFNGVIHVIDSVMIPESGSGSASDAGSGTQSGWGCGH